MKNLLILSLMLSSTAFAGAPSEPTKPVKEGPVANGGYADSWSNADADSHSFSNATSQAAGGSVGDINASATSEGSSADNSLTLNYERSAPGLGQGSLYIPQCGVAGNAGGSNSNGAGFLGVAWTPKDCKRLLAAAAFQSLGMYDAACEQLMTVSVVRDYYAAKPASERPNCKEKRAPVPPAPIPAVVVNPPACPVVDQGEREKRILERCVGK